MIYRQGRNYENLNKMIYRGTGKFDTPRLVPEACNADSFIGFNYAKSCKDPQTGRYVDIHVYMDQAVKGATKLVRIDNLKPTALLEKCVKKRDK